MWRNDAGVCKVSRHQAILFQLLKTDDIVLDLVDFK